MGMSPRVDRHLLIPPLLFLAGCAFFHGESAGTNRYSGELRSGDPVRIADACKHVIANRYHEAVPDLIENLRSQDLATRYWCHFALIHFYHEKPPWDAPFPGVMEPELSKREVAIRAWQNWWETTGQKRYAEEAARAGAAPAKSGR